MRVGPGGEVSRGLLGEAARHLARAFDVPEGGGYVGKRARGFAGLCAPGEIIVEWCDGTTRDRLAPRGGLAFDFGRGARWREARELAQVILARRCRQVYRTRWVEPILADEFTRQIVRHLPAYWHLSDEALSAWLWRFELRRWEAFGPVIWRQVQRDLAERRARYAVRVRC